MPDLVTLLNAAIQILIALVGFPAALSAALAILMKFGLTAELAAQISFWANVAAFVGIAYLVFTGQTALVAVIDASLAGLAKLLADILVILGGFAVSLASTGKYTLALAEHTTNFRDARALMR